MEGLKPPSQDETRSHGHEAITSCNLAYVGARVRSLTLLFLQHGHAVNGIPMALKVVRLGSVKWIC